MAVGTRSLNERNWAIFNVGRLNLGDAPPRVQMCVGECNRDSNGARSVRHFAARRLTALSARAVVRCPPSCRAQFGGSVVLPFAPSCHPNELTSNLLNPAPRLLSQFLLLHRR